MNRGLIAIVFVACLLGTFVVTYAWQSQPSEPAGAGDPLRALGNWLELRPGQLQRMSEVDATFAQESRELEQRLAAERERLAELFESDEADDARIMAQVERVIVAHDNLERRVARYLLALRPHLTDQQRARLFKRCAETVRQGCGKRWGKGWGGGRGHGPRGRGRGPQWKGGPSNTERDEP